MTDAVLVGLSVVIQATAAAYALLLNRRHGWQWSWLLISIGFLVMTARRSLTFYHLVFAESLTAEKFASEFAAATSLISSVFLLMGVLLMGPLFRSILKAQETLHQDRDRLATSLSTAESDLSAAQLIQERLFPDQDFIEHDVMISGNCRPMHFVAGDYFDFFPLTDGSITVVVADVVGHGVGPAILMAELRACLRTAVLHTDDPAVLMTEANCLISEFATAGRFATSFLAVIHRAERMISFVGAGHEAWLIHSDGFVEYLRPDNLPLGIDRSEHYNVQHVGYRSGDLLLLATDGITEASDPDGSTFGVSRMLKTVVDQRMNLPNQLVQSLMCEVIEFRRGAEQQDDITAVVARFEG